MKNFWAKMENLIMSSVMLEAGSRKLAMSYLHTEPKAQRQANKGNLQEFLQDIGLQNIKVYYGTGAL